MKNLVFAATIASSLAFAAEPAKADAKPAAAPAADAKPAGENPMASWKPKKVTKKDTKGIDALYASADEAWKKHDAAAAEALHDFPVFMLTDNSAGATMGGEWSKETWEKMMKPAFENMPADAKMTRKVKPTFITDSIAFVEESNTMTVGRNKPETWTSGSIVVLKDGKWLFKAGAEGGWGDMPMPKEEKKTEAAPAAAPGTKTADAKPAAQPAAAPAKK